MSQSHVRIVDKQPFLQVDDLFPAKASKTSSMSSVMHGNRSFVRFPAIRRVPKPSRSSCSTYGDRITVFDINRKRSSLAEFEEENDDDDADSGCGIGMSREKHARSPSGRYVFVPTKILPRFLDNLCSSARPCRASTHFRFSRFVSVVRNSSRPCNGSPIEESRSMPLSASRRDRNDSC